MTAYLVADIEVTDNAVFAEYRRRAPEVVAAHSGRYLARGSVVELLDGEAPARRLTILEFPDMARLKSFYHSAAYQELVAIRNRSARCTFMAIEGV